MANRWINFVDKPPLHPNRVGGSMQPARRAPDNAETVVLKEDKFGLFNTLTANIAKWFKDNKARVNIIHSVFGTEYNEETRQHIRINTITYTTKGA